MKKYNAEVDADDRVGDLERPDSERFTVHKPKYPTGTLSVVLDKEQEEIVVSYSFTSAGGEGSKVSSQTAKFPILVEGGRLLLGQNEGERIGPPPERMIKWDLRGEGGMGIEDAVREILAPFFNGI